MYRFLNYAVIKIKGTTVEELREAKAALQEATQNFQDAKLSAITDRNVAIASLTRELAELESI